MGMDPTGVPSPTPAKQAVLSSVRITGSRFHTPAALQQTIGNLTGSARVSDGRHMSVSSAMAVPGVPRAGVATTGMGATTGLGGAVTTGRSTDAPCLFSFGAANQ